MCAARGPAAYCGLAGIKPTYGLVSRTGILPLAFSLDHAGPLAWNAEDCAILLQAMAGHDPSDPAKDGKQHRYWSVVENTRVARGAWCSGTCCIWARSTTRKS